MPVEGREMPDSAAGGQSGPNVEAPAVLFERRSREEHFRQSARICFKLLRFGGRVTVAKNQKIDLVSGSPVF